MSLKYIEDGIDRCSRGVQIIKNTDRVFIEAYQPLLHGCPLQPGLQPWGPPSILAGQKSPAQQTLPYKEITCRLCSSLVCSLGFLTPNGLRSPCKSSSSKSGLCGEELLRQIGHRKMMG